MPMNYMPNPLISPPRPSTATGIGSPFDGKRQPRLKESQFQYKYGQRHHSYDPEKAPYPVSYDRHVLELESMQNRLIQYMRGSVSLIDFKGEALPTHSLDLGCGLGSWVLDAAEEWPECHFVGFDLVNIQVPLKLLEPSIAERVQWVHGNFLTTKLPFDDGEFDHVHIQNIARGVPENKWGVLFEEINRVLRPGGVVEIIEDDIIFPTLPRWFTAPLRTLTRRSTSVHLPDSSQRGHAPSPPPSPQNTPPHDHALLESLYHSIFESRFINLRPTAILPIYFTTYFRRVYLGPPIHFPMPPLPPLQPLPQQVLTPFSVIGSTDVLDRRASSVFSSHSLPIRPASMSFSSSVSASTSSSNADSAMASIFSVRAAIDSSETMDASAPPHENDSSSSSSGNETISPPKLFMVDNGEDQNSAFRPSTIDQLATLSERSVAMHLYRAYQSVLACQEAMWEELKDRLRNRRDELKPFGWDDDEELEELQSRSKFERLIERYRGDMQARVALWCSLSNLNWPIPTREPLSKAELIEEKRIHNAMLGSRKFASLEDFQTPSRTSRVLVGYNEF